MGPLIISKKPRLRSPYLIVAWPGMGDVAANAANYLINELKAQEFAEIAPGEFFYSTGSVISSGILEVPLLPQGKFYYWKNPASKRAVSANSLGAKPAVHDLIIFLSNAQPDLAKADSYAKIIIGLAKDLGAELVVSFASMPQATDHTQKPAVWLAATDQKIKEGLKKFNFNVLQEGQISGMNGLFLGLAKLAGLKGFCLLGDIPLYTIQIENPKASAAVLQALGQILNIQINLQPLMEQAQSMENEINKLLEYLKLGSGGQSAPIGEEEVELIKKTLSQLTKLPVSIKEKIEKLFEESRINITKANGLKAELDKWNVYKEYEDRFLDLFRKNKDKGN
ncbi:MAG: PAC2 family protein [Candidatus Omnitrophica bacterium]|nr:PAC2 family protein [Candidatus Omnitrophota bacterium]MDD5660916.1 PAC2 family protein [Candidatus Omnitrophota bacterium]